MVLALIATILGLIGCGHVATLPVAAGSGPNPTLPPPDKSLFPTVNIALARGWPEGQTPMAPAGMRVVAFADQLEHPRWIYELPNGDILVAETNAPPKPDDGKGIRGWFQGLVMKRAGAATPSANRITLLRDANGDGIAEMRSTFIDGLSSPFGMSLVGEDLYIANTDALVRYHYQMGDEQLNGPATQVTELPAGRINHHWTKNVIANSDGTKLYVTVGSNSNIGENGLAAEQGRAAIWEVDAKSGAHRLFASGLRNPNGMAWEPATGVLWTVVNERDEIGSDLVPDYLTSVQDGAFYGWPYSYFGNHVDERVQPQRPDLVERAIVPDYALGPHTASLGLAWSAGNTLPNSLPDAFGEGMFIGQHGSWNRKPFSGYKVVFVPFLHGQPNGPVVDVLTGFLSDGGEAYGRPVGVAIDQGGGLLVADDVGNIIWRVTAATPIAD
ncbi:MAG: sorbosone dehydrogenase family protein [Xanthomonadales bacterium]|nr:sorbosone dehydrogenase family protein [Xanthomonadales bacterium]